jgi:hypothetical protein
MIGRSENRTLLASMLKLRGALRGVIDMPAVSHQSLYRQLAGLDRLLSVPWLDDLEVRMAG